MIDRSLSQSLFAEVDPAFFRLLSGVNSALYIDVLQAVHEAMHEPALGLAREDVVSVISGVLEGRADELQGDSEGETPPTRRSEQATWILNRLLATGWLEEPRRADFQRIIYFDSGGELLLFSLRHLARPEETRFTGKLRLVCDRLSDPAAATHFTWDDLEACRENAADGLRELRQMRKGVDRHTRRQARAETLRENLSVLYDQFSETIGHGCYRELVRARLPSKLQQARRALEELAGDSAFFARLVRDLRKKRPSLAAGEAGEMTLRMLDDLALALAQVEPQAGQVDEHTSDFARRSLARFRYLQEVGGNLRAGVRSLFEFINDKFAGGRMVDLPMPGEWIPELLVHEVRLPGGLESLHPPRRKAVLPEVEPIATDNAPEAGEEALAEMAANLRDSLTLGRAHRFLDRLTISDGPIASRELPAATSEDLVDIIATLLHAEAREARYKLTVERIAADVDKPGTHSVGAYEMEAFTLELQRKPGQEAKG